jgi:hypothetical protein
VLLLSLVMLLTPATLLPIPSLLPSSPLPLMWCCAAVVLLLCCCCAAVVLLLCCYCAAVVQAVEGRLMPFATAAQLLGGRAKATEILSRDITIMLMDPDVLAAKLHNLQQLLSGDADWSPGAQQQQQQGATQHGKQQQQQYSKQAQQKHAVLAVGAVQAQQQQPQEVVVLHTPQQQEQQQQQQQQQQACVSDDVLALVTSHPGILRLNADRLVARLVALQECLGLGSRGEVLQVCAEEQGLGLGFGLPVVLMHQSAWTNALVHSDEIMCLDNRG